MIDRYAGSLSGSGLMCKQISFRGDILISKERIEAYFYSLDQRYADSEQSGADSGMASRGNQRSRKKGA